MKRIIKFLGTAVWVVSGVLIMLVILTILRDFVRLTEPGEAVIVRSRIIPMDNGWHQLKMIIDAPASPYCIRFRYDLLSVQEYPHSVIVPDDEPIPDGFAPLGMSMNGISMGIVTGGPYPLQYAIPPFVKGVWWLHNRFTYICPLGDTNGRLFFKMGSRTRLMFPE